MRIVEQRVADVTPIIYWDMVKTVSRCARTCYNSYDKAGTREYEERFIKGLIKGCTATMHGYKNVYVCKHQRVETHLQDAL